MEILSIKISVFEEITWGLGTMISYFLGGLYWNTEWIKVTGTFFILFYFPLLRWKKWLQRSNEISWNITLPYMNGKRTWHHLRTYRVTIETLYSIPWVVRCYSSGLDSDLLKLVSIQSLLTPLCLLPQDQVTSDRRQQIWIIRDTIGFSSW